MMVLFLFLFVSIYQSSFGIPHPGWVDGRGVERPMSGLCLRGLYEKEDGALMTGDGSYGMVQLLLIGRENDRPRGGGLS